MNVSYRIPFNINNQDSVGNIKIRLEQNVETLEMLSLKMETKDAYRAFNSDYGVLVGRVIANDGIGIANAKVSIFIPLTEEDENNGDIVGIYPYKRPTDKNSDGKRYNLLPRVSKYIDEKDEYRPKQPFGSFPTKPEIITNKNFLNVYKKYYKFSTVTNSSGDYMIYGAPVGQHTVHLSVDITDIGEYSLTPPVMVTELGYSPNLFTDNGTKIKESTDLNDLPNIETQEISVDVIPFWGDKQNFEIGITRQDFRIRAQLVNVFTVFGTAFTDGSEATWGTGIDGDSLKGFYRMYPGMGGGADNQAESNISIITKRVAPITERIVYYPFTVDDTVIDSVGGANDDGSDMAVLSQTEYTSYKNGGDFVYTIKCNRKKKITNEVGELVDVDDTYPGGLFTEFRGFFLFEITDNDLFVTDKTSLLWSDADINLTPIRTKIKVPQTDVEGWEGATSAAKSFDYRLNIGGTGFEWFYGDWIKQHKVFKGGNYYSLARFNGLVHNNGGAGSSEYTGGFVESDSINLVTNIRGQNVGVIYAPPGTSFPRNHVNNFGADWLNFALYLPQISHTVENKDVLNNLKSNTYISSNIKGGDSILFPASQNPYTLNSMPLGGGLVNSAAFLRADLHWTDFVEVDVRDLRTILGEFNAGNIGKGFTWEDVGGVPENTVFRNRINTISGDSKNIFNNKPAYPPLRTLGADYNIYFYLGLNESNCIMFLSRLGLI